METKDQASESEQACSLSEKFRHVPESSKKAILAKNKLPREVMKNILRGNPVGSSKTQPKLIYRGQINSYVKTQESMNDGCSEVRTIHESKLKSPRMMDTQRTLWSKLCAIRVALKRSRKASTDSLDTEGSSNLLDSHLIGLFGSFILASTMASLKLSM
ncbi:hypothetical protein ACH5RR_017714 [Cinchona calisaya]|uniref:Uncharacterized protein n=1 Tax=Cinchona calisaya TaxID=153742 RepID=A0ABD2ZML2_9GENT